MGERKRGGRGQMTRRRRRRAGTFEKLQRLEGRREWFGVSSSAVCLSPLLPWQSHSVICQRVTAVSALVLFLVFFHFFSSLSNNCTLFHPIVYLVLFLSVKIILVFLCQIVVIWPSIQNYVYDNQPPTPLLLITAL